MTDFAATLTDIASRPVVTEVVRAGGNNRMDCVPGVAVRTRPSWTSPDGRTFESKSLPLLVAAIIADRAAC